MVFASVQEAVACLVGLVQVLEAEMTEEQGRPGLMRQSTKEHLVHLHLAKRAQGVLTTKNELEYLGRCRCPELEPAWTC